MVTFSTEFPVKRALNRALFLAQVVAWLRGTSYSKVLEDRSDEEVEGETAYLRSSGGETLRLRELIQSNNSTAIGFRHDFPDNEGRLWRTEAVVRQGVLLGGEGLLRLRTQCIAREPSARLDRPRKPYLIKAILKDQLGGRDGVIDVVDQPIWLTHDEASLEIARDITQGRASRHLPIVYISAIDQSRWLLDRHEIEKLAYDLGGVSHVIVEPDRAFSFKLRDITNGMNAYGGTLGIALPDQGIVRRVYLGWQLQSVLDLLTATRSICISLRSNLPAEGWDWTELQEEVLRRQRERDRNRLGAEEFEKLYLEEIDNLKDKIKQLEEQIISLATSEKTFQHRDQNLFGTLSERLGPEIYPGEFGDRLRLAAKLACADAERTGLDVRSRAVLAALVDKLPPSPALRELLEDLKRATKDFKRAASELTVLLQRHGFREKSDNKHIRLEAREGFIGLETITLPKTPSESRGLSNLRTQIERTLGITKLDK